MKKVESEIKTLCDQYNEKLMQQKKDITDQLTKWSEILIRRIQEHVTAQKKILDEHCVKRKQFFEAERKRIITNVAPHQKKNEIDEVERLIAEFKNLKLNLPVLDKYETPTFYMRVLTEEAPPSKELDKTNAQQTEEKQSQDTVPEDNNNNNNNNNNAGNTASGSRRSSIRLPSAKIKPASDEPKDPAAPTEHNPPSSATDSSEATGESEDGMLDKCPVCFMMFPKTMKKDDRNLHINEHYEDN